jgi:hypothetical protein
LSKLISGATLISENQGPGSYAATREHGSRGFQRIAGDSEWIGETFAACVGRPFVSFNNLGARPPVLMIHVVRDDDPEKRLKLFASARNELGIPVSMQQVRQEIQLKPPTGPDDEVPGVKGMEATDEV